MSHTLSVPVRRSASATPWSLGRAPRSYVLSNVRAVLSDRVTDRASVVVEQGRIAAIVERSQPLVGDADGGGLLLLPGLIDTHSDALERERVPRSNAELPWDFALASFETKLVGAGVTTVFHGAAFQNTLGVGGDRSPSNALELCDTVDRHPNTRVDHRVLHRLGIRSADGAGVVGQRLAARPDDAEPILLSHEDHTPGQGQYADVALFIDQRVANGADRAEVAARVEQNIAEAQRTDHVRDTNLSWIAQLAEAGKVRLLGHDPDSAAAIDALVERGGRIAEFPTTLEAAQRARATGLLIVAGAPNVLRGGSHSGNIAAVELISAGLVDALASDYLPTGLLGSVATLVRHGIADLPAAVGLVTAGPAAVAGFDDRGRIAPGLAADFALVDDRTSWPHVVTTLKAAPATEPSAEEQT